jgi:hypothetical protein
MLQAVDDIIATNYGRGCCRRWDPVLPRKDGNATIGVRWCYKGRSSMLQSVVDNAAMWRCGATIGMWHCYHRMCDDAARRGGGAPLELEAANTAFVGAASVLQAHCQAPSRCVAAVLQPQIELALMQARRRRRRIHMASPPRGSW